MELIAVPFESDDLARCAFVDVRHSETGLERGLDHDESVVVLDAEGGFHAAVVDEVGFTLEDTTYRLRLGVRLPADLAADRLSGSPLTLERQQLHEIADLIGELRDGGAAEGVRDVEDLLLSVG